MKFIIKVKYSLLRCCLIFMIAGIPIISVAQEIIDTSAPEDPLIAPTIAVPPSTIEPDCHTYTGCGVIVIKKLLIFAQHWSEISVLIKCSRT